MSEEKERSMMTVAQVSEEFQVGLRTVRRWIREGQLPAYKIGHLIRVYRSDLEQFITPIK